MTYTYDQARNDAQSNPYRNLGRLTTIGTEAITGGPPETATEYDYDQMGQVVAQRQKVGSTTYTLGYTYDLIGDLLTETYHSGRVMTYAYDEGARLSSVSTTVSGTTSTLSDTFQYEPHGGMSSERFGNTYDGGSTGTGNITSDSKFRNLTYGYDANGRQKSASN